jgi:hypothetical protein
MRERVVLALGVDQGDRETLSRVVEQYDCGEGFDLIVDDASHILTPTRISFEVLFPRLRENGLYVIEDWSTECITASRLAADLTDLDEGTFRSRLDAVNRLFQILNSPVENVPDEVVASLSAAASADEGASSDLFAALAHAAARADLSRLEPLPHGSARPLADFAVELMMLSALRPDVVREVRVDAEWLVVRRGPAELPRDTFALGDYWRDYYGYLD